MIRGKSSASRRLEWGIYGGVRWLALIVTATAFVVTASATIIAGFELLSGNGFHLPSTTYRDFQENISTHTQEVKTAPSPTDDSDTKYNAYIAATFRNLTGYAAKVGQPKPSEAAFTGYAKQQLARVRDLTGTTTTDSIDRNDSVPLGYIAGLEKITGDLAADGDRLAALKVDDPSRVRWDTFLDWYTGNYENKLQAEIQSKRSEVPTLQNVAVIGAAIIVLGVFLLVILRIELNTRPKPAAGDRVVDVRIVGE